MNRKIAAAKKFASDHRVAITVVATATPLLALVIRNQKVFNEFLVQENLLEKFYAMDEI